MIKNYIFQVPSAKVSFSHMSKSNIACASLQPLKCTSSPFVFFPHVSGGGFSFESFATEPPFHHWRYGKLVKFNQVLRYQEARVPFPSLRGAVELGGQCLEHSRGLVEIVR